MRTLLSITTLFSLLIALSCFQSTNQLVVVDAFIIDHQYIPSIYKIFLGRNDLYKVLGISRSASDKEINKAFRKLSREWHPDSSRHPNAKEHYAKILTAKSVLLHEQKRTMYDWFGLIEGESEEQQGGGTTNNDNKRNTKQDQQQKPPSFFSRVCGFVLEKVNSFSDNPGAFWQQDEDEEGDQHQQMQSIEGKEGDMNTDDDDDDDSFFGGLFGNSKKKRRNKSPHHHENFRSRDPRWENFKLPPEVEEKLLRVIFILIVHFLDFVIAVFVGHSLCLMIAVGIMYFCIRPMWRAVRGITRRF